MVRNNPGPIVQDEHTSSTESTEKPRESDTSEYTSSKKVKKKRKAEIHPKEVDDEKYSKKMKVSSIFTKNPEIPQIIRYVPPKLQTFNFI